MRDRQAVRVAGVKTFVVGDHEVLWSPVTDRLVAVADTSRLLWSAIDGTRNPDDLVDVVAGKDADESRRGQVLSALDEFAAAGLLADRMPPQTTGDLDTQTPTHFWPVPDFDSNVGVGLDELGPFVALDWRFTVRCSSDFLRDELRWFLEPLRCTSVDALAQRTPVGRYLVDVPVDDPSRSIHVYLDEVFAFSAPGGREALETMQADISFRAVSLTDGAVVFHAAAVCRDGTTMILPAASGAGKTSLAAALVAAGWTFITDELASIKVAGHTMTPFRRAIVVTLEVAQAIGLKSESRAGARSGETRTWVLDPQELEAMAGIPSPSASESIAGPTLVVAPRFVQGAELEITELSALETFSHLVECRFSGKVGTAEGLSLVADLANTATGWRVVHGDATLAAAAIGELVGAGGS